MIELLATMLLAAEVEASSRDKLIMLVGMVAFGLWGIILGMNNIITKTDEEQSKHVRKFYRLIGTDNSYHGKTAIIFGIVKILAGLTMIAIGIGLYIHGLDFIAIVGIWFSQL